jgi:hypothetical protein
MEVVHDPWKRFPCRVATARSGGGRRAIKPGEERAILQESGIMMNRIPWMDWIDLEKWQMI